MKKTTLARYGSRILLAVFASIALSGCLSEFTQSAVTVSEDNSAVTAPGLVDLSKLAIGTSQRLVFELEGGGSCECALASSGSKSLGTLLVLGCVAQGATTATSVECGVLADTYSFAVADAGTRICDGKGLCSAY